MGFPVGYTELFLPKLFLHTLSLLGLLRRLVSSIFALCGLSDFLEPDIVWHHHHHPNNNNNNAPPPAAQPRSVSAALLRELLPVVRFADLPDAPSLPDACAVCLYEFEPECEIRRLANCRHVFHRGCLDRWMDCDQRTCPLCRTAFVPDEMQDDFNERFWAASGIPDLYGEYASITGL
uniref:RING-type domain-containing protein n=1 Tax=Kalanchoe fedtschenkoi TaxID=63787 RepID=A0A7N0U286_KALFE